MGRRIQFQQFEKPAPANANAGGKLPDSFLNHFKCPITQDFFQDPVLAMDGYWYDWEGIIAWLQNHHTSPTTNLPMVPVAVSVPGRVALLRENLDLRSVMADLRQKN